MKGERERECASQSTSRATDSGAAAYFQILDQQSIQGHGTDSHVHPHSRISMIKYLSSPIDWTVQDFLMPLPLLLVLAYGIHHVFPLSVCTACTSISVVVAPAKHSLTNMLCALYPDSLAVRAGYSHALCMSPDGPPPLTVSCSADTSRQ